MKHIEKFGGANVKYGNSLLFFFFFITFFIFLFFWNSDLKLSKWGIFSPKFKIFCYGGSFTLLQIQSF